MSRILIIEDEEAIADLEKDYLELSDFEVEIEHTGNKGLEKALNGNFDLVILDLMLPEMDGFEVCKKIREEKNIPILMVSAKKDDIDKIRGLGLGADDYMVKPFLPKEFLLRVTALLRRTYGNILPENGFFLPDPDCGKREIRFDTALVLRGEEEIPLTPKELILLKVLYGQKNRIVTSDALTMAAWGDTRV